MMLAVVFAQAAVKTQEAEIDGLQINERFGCR